MLYCMAMVPGRRWRDGHEHHIQARPLRDNQTVLLLCPPGEPGYRPLALSVLRLENGWVAEAIDFEVPMRFSVLARFQQGRGRI